MYIQERKGETLPAMGARAEEYVEMHHFSSSARKGRTAKDDSRKPAERGGAKPNLRDDISGTGDKNLTATV